MSTYPPSQVATGVATGMPAADAPLDSARGEIRALTGLRLFAALWVLAFHLHLTPGETYARYWESLHPLVVAGELGVDLFFVLSGVVIAHTYARKLGPGLRARAVGSFVWARLSRIWPVYAVLTVGFGAWLVFRAQFDSDGKIAYQAIQPDIGIGSWLQQLVMVQLWSRPVFDGSSFVGPAWSISAEWLAYLLFPLLVLVAWRLRWLPAPVLGGLALLPLAPQVVFAVAPPAPPFTWAMRILGGFTSGMLVWLALRRVPRTPRVSRIAGWVALAAIVEIGIVLWWAAAIDSYEAKNVAVLAFPVLLGALALGDRGPAAVLSRPWAVHGGRISFSLYLIHIPIIELYWTAMDNIPAMAAGTALATLVLPHLLVISLLAAHLLWRWVEEPAREWLRERDPFRGRQPSVAPRSATTVPETRPLDLQEA
ncbi:MAG: acyltransferase family protein [Pseudonocardiaceae bacterium]